MENEEKYLSLNEIDNAINSLIVAKEFIEKDEIFKWKWVAIALHHSLYSFCISALLNGNYDNVLSFAKNDDSDGWLTRDDEKWKRLCKKKYNDRWYYRIYWVDTVEKPPEKKPTPKNNSQQNLIGFWSALARAMDGEYWMGRLDGTKPLQINDMDLEKIYWVTKFVRNDLVHFIPKIKVLDIDYLKECLFVMIKSIEFLFSESRSIKGFTINPHPSINEAITIIKEELSKQYQALLPVCF